MYRLHVDEREKDRFCTRVGQSFSDSAWIVALINRNEKVLLKIGEIFGISLN